MTAEMAEFIRAQTVPASASLVPEITLQLATEVTPLWHLTEERLRENNLPPPYWAFAWPGGQGLARYILDHPETVRGRRVLDFAAGCGIAAIAAARAGAARAMADDIDLLAQTVVPINAAHNGVRVDIERITAMDKPFTGADIILLGDVCYQQAMSIIIMRWLRLCLGAGVRVIIADPGRAYVPTEGMKELARYDVPTSRDLEDRDSRTVIVWELLQAV
ncbi:MAG: methyltransferase [Bdellovibrionales bacterium]